MLTAPCGFPKAQTFGAKMPLFTDGVPQTPLEQDMLDALAAATGDPNVGEVYGSVDHQRRHGATKVREGFAVRGRTQAGQLPLIDVHGVGPLKFPASPAELDAVKAIAVQSPFGKGEETVVDLCVRHSVELQPRQFTITNSEAWEPIVQAMARILGKETGMEAVVEAHLYKLLIYAPDGHFDWHTDTPKEPGMFGTLCVVLPQTFTGGTLCCRATGNSKSRPAMELPSPFGDYHRPSYDTVSWMAFLAQCKHRVEPIATGHRVALVYNVVQTAARRLEGGAPAAHPGLTQLIRSWADLHRDDAQLMTFMLDRKYPPAHVQIGRLLGDDRLIADAVAAAATAADCTVYFACLDHDARWLQDDNPDEDPISDLRTLQGVELDVPSQPLHNCYPMPNPPDGYDSYSEADDPYGNEGAGSSYRYHRTALVVLASRLGTFALYDPSEQDTLALEQAKKARDGDESAAYIVKECLRQHLLKADRACDLVQQLGDVALAEAMLRDAVALKLKARVAYHHSTYSWPSSITHEIRVVDDVNTQVTVAARLVEAFHLLGLWETLMQELHPTPSSTAWSACLAMLMGSCGQCTILAMRDRASAARDAVVRCIERWQANLHSFESCDWTGIRLLSALEVEPAFSHVSRPWFLAKDMPGLAAFSDLHNWSMSCRLAAVQLELCNTPLNTWSFVPTGLLECWKAIQIAEQCIQSPASSEPTTWSMSQSCACGQPHCVEAMTWLQQAAPGAATFKCGRQGCDHIAHICAGVNQIFGARHLDADFIKAGSRWTVRVTKVAPVPVPGIPQHRVQQLVLMRGTTPASRWALVHSFSPETQAELGRMCVPVPLHPSLRWLVRDAVPAAATGATTVVASARPSAVGAVSVASPRAAPTVAVPTSAAGPAADGPSPTPVPKPAAGAVSSPVKRSIPTADMDSRLAAAVNVIMTEAESPVKQHRSTSTPLRLAEVDERLAKAMDDAVAEIESLRSSQSVPGSPVAPVRRSNPAPASRSITSFFAPVSGQQDRPPQPVQQASKTTRPVEVVDLVDDDDDNDEGRLPPPPPAKAQRR